jgi:hypothetical protein
MELYTGFIMFGALDWCSKIIEMANNKLSAPSPSACCADPMKSSQGGLPVAQENSSL